LHTVVRNKRREKTYSYTYSDSTKGNTGPRRESDIYDFFVVQINNKITNNNQ